MLIIKIKPNDEIKILFSYFGYNCKKSNISNILVPINPGMGSGYERRARLCNYLYFLFLFNTISLPSGFVIIFV
jgi:hypothetical protein